MTKTRLAGAVVAVAVVGVLAGYVLFGSGGPTPQPVPAAQLSGNISTIIRHTPPRRLHREVEYIRSAEKSALGSEACEVKSPYAGFPFDDKVTYLTGRPGRDLRSLLGVLRHPATRADRVTPTLASAVGGVPGVYRHWVREALTADGVTYYIVPTRSDRAGLIPSSSCVARQTAAITREMASSPQHLRQTTLALQAALRGYLEKLLPLDTVCLVSICRNVPGGVANGSSDCGISAAQIKRTFWNSEGQGVYAGIVPDGAATVQLSLNATSIRRAGTGTVKNNVFVVHAKHGASANPLAQPTITWRNANGQLVKRFASPTPVPPGTNPCKAHPVGCLIVDTAVSVGAHGGAPSPSGG